jgi:hypothetical protein
VAAKTGVWPLLQFARAAESGASARDLQGLAAVHALLENVVHKDDWGRFQEDMIVKKADDLEALLEFAGQAVDLLQERQSRTGRTKPAEAIPGEVEE